MKRLLKFDVVHPAAYLQRKQAEWIDLDQISLSEYRARLNALRSNYSDYYTYPLNQTGEWEAEEYYLMDDVFADKVAQEVMGPVARLRAKASVSPYRYLWRTALGYQMMVADAYIRRFKPDVIFVRSQPFPSAWWNRFRKNTLLVARLSARMPRKWHPEDFDLIYTDQPDFQHFFELHGVETILNKQGFDNRVSEELTPASGRVDVSFVGGLGTQNFSKRTALFESIAGKIDLEWWGYWWAHGGDGRTLDDFPALNQAFEGPTSGLEMYQLFRDSKISLNDYVDTANGMGYNQRIFEVLGSEGFLLTREAHNFVDHFPRGVFATYASEGECLEKIDHYLKHPDERAAIARAGREFVNEHFSFNKIALDFAEDLDKRLTSSVATWT